MVRGILIIILLMAVLTAAPNSTSTATPAKELPGEHTAPVEKNNIGTVKVEQIITDAVPQKINLQGYLTTANGDTFSGNCSILFKIYRGGSEIWQEIQTVGLQKSLFSVILGSVSPITSSIFEPGSTCEMELIVEGQTLSPRIEITSVGFAFKSVKSDTASYALSAPLARPITPLIYGDEIRDTTITTGKIKDGVVTMPKINQSGATTGQVIKWTGTAWTPRNDSAGGPPSGPAGGDLAGTYPNPSIANNAINTTKIADGQVQTGDIADLNVTSGKIADNAVTTTKIQDGQVQTNDIADANVSLAKINPTGSTAGQVLTSTGPGTVPSWSNPTPSLHDHLGETWTTTTDNIGLRTNVDLNTSSLVIGKYDSVVNAGTGETYGAIFNVGGSGTGSKFGVCCSVDAPPSSGQTYGVKGKVLNQGASNAYGGLFSSFSTGGGINYGVLGSVTLFTGSGYGVYGGCALYSNQGEPGYGGVFSVSGSGIGPRYGVSASAGAPSGNINDAYGVRGSCTHDGPGNAYGGYFSAGGVTGTKFGVFGTTSGSGTQYAGYFNGNHVITGTKSAAVKIGKDDWRLVYCQESPELWFEDFGQCRLQNGKAHIELDPIFLKTVTISNEHPMNVFVQLKDDCNGVYVKDDKTGFDVIELQNGKSNARFIYRVVAKRAGYENLRLKKMEPGTNPEELEAEQAKYNAHMEKVTKESEISK